MRKATITETKNQLSALLDRVRRGETILILDRGRPVARIESIVGSAADDADGRLSRLEREAVVRRGRAAVPRAVLAKRPPRPRPGAAASRALVAERREGR
jgi:prevent-host-death family protein